MSWEKVKLGDLCQMNSGGTPSRTKLSYYNGTIPWAKISDIEAAEGGIVYTTEEHITKGGLAAINNRIFPKGTLLLAMYGSVGKVGFAGSEMSTNQAILGIRVKDEKQLSYAYLKYWFQTIKESLLNRAVGGTLQNISLSIVKELQIPLPSLPIQKRIAEILDKADALRRKDQLLLQKYDQLAQAIFINMFGDPVKNEKGWEVKKLGELGNWKSGGTPLRSKKEYFEGDIPWLSSGELNDVYVSMSKEHVSKDAIAKSATSLIKPGSLLLGMYDTAALKSSINTVSLCCNQAIAFARLEDAICDTMFVYCYIQFAKEHLRREQRGVRQKNMNLSMIKDMEILFPPLIMQKDFAKKYLTILSQKQLIHNNRSNSLFQTLLQKAFKGELTKINEYA